MNKASEALQTEPSAPAPTPAETMSPPAPPVKKPKFQKHFHYFRSFAILNVMMVHLWRLPEEYDTSQLSSTIQRVREYLFHDSTIYFIFISGYLFRYLAVNFKWQKFYVAKLKNVAVPYLVWTLFVVLFEIFILKVSGVSLGTVLSNLFTGKTQVQYWYIPFIIPIFVISPLLLKIPTRYLNVIVMLSLFLPLLGTRTGTENTIGQYLFFFPVYLFGIFVASHSEKFDAWMTRYRAFVLVVFVASTVLLFFVDSSAEILFINPHESLHYLHKLSITLLILPILKGLSKKEIGILNQLANLSFALYFSHWFLFCIFYVHVYRAASWLAGEHLFFPSLVIAFFFVGLSLGLMYVAKKVLGRYSRFLIGA